MHISNMRLKKHKNETKAFKLQEILNFFNKIKSLIGSFIGSNSSFKFVSV